MSCPAGTASTGWPTPSPASTPATGSASPTAAPCSGWRRRTGSALRPCCPLLKHCTGLPLALLSGGVWRRTGDVPRVLLHAVLGPAHLLTGIAVTCNMPGQEAHRRVWSSVGRLWEDQPRLVVRLPVVAVTAPSLQRRLGGTAEPAAVLPTK